MTRKNLYLFISCLAFSANCLAGLGEHFSSIANDQKKFQIQKLNVSTLPKYTVHEISKTNLTLKEFVNADGIIFAVTWKGSAQPDLNTLLGPYQNECAQAMKVRQRQPGLHRIGKTVSENVVIERSIFGRAAQGRATVTSLIPAGVSLSDIR